MAQTVKTLLETKEIQIRSLGREDPLEKGMATYSSILAWRILWTKEPGGLQSVGSQRVGQDWATSAFPWMCQLVSFLCALFFSLISLSGIAFLLIPCNSNHLLLSWPVMYLLRPTLASPPSSGFCEDLLLQAHSTPCRDCAFKFFVIFIFLVLSIVGTNEVVGSYDGWMDK